METNLKTHIVTIDNEVYDRILEIANQMNLEEITPQNNDERVAITINKIVNAYYKNYKIDNLLF
jgi:flagellar basal body-associated protein FliL